MPISTEAAARGLGATLLALLAGGCATLGVHAPATAPASVAPPALPRTASAQQRRRVVAALRLGQAVLPLEKVPLTVILQIAGTGDIRQQGDASEALSWICYTAGTGAARQRLWLGSDEVGGGNLDRVIARSLPAQTPANAACPELPAGLQPVALGTGFWLGDTLSQLQALAPFAATQPYQTIVHDEPAGYGFTETSWLTLGIENGHVTQLWASKSTGN